MNLEQISEKIAGEIQSGFVAFEGYDVRADAGESGMIYVALRGAKKETDLGERFADGVGRLVEGRLEEMNVEVDFAVSMGRGMRDLLLQVELRPKGR